MLWIVTQNNDSFVNVKEVTVKGKNIIGIIGSEALDQWSKTLGKYESKERALEILEELFMKMDENDGFYITFTMPEK
ncbi:hypothetical protein LC087_15835 [Bacillus carboniphilus]|uniref:Uncharacterized protein n=1 Tax=Bacillus carboniphilus TaxID=86663 RepID=A0ABY9JUM8_9BACI|nr:hypothetical protein [Bacillus carboniphilus]WLR42193.1 hypothetical protein LC087_15835 [Bacillus carboniphilus]